MEEDETKNPNQDSEGHGKEEMFYAAIGHDIRRKIVKIIGKDKIVGFSHIKKETKASTGTIYHHLDALQDLITQDAKKKYHLTTLGEHAYRFLSQNLDSIQSTSVTEKLIEDEKTRFRDNFLLKPFFKYCKVNPQKGLLINLGFVTITAILSAILNLRAFLFFFFPLSNPEESILSQIGIFFSVWVGFGILFGITELLSRFLFDKKEGSKELFQVIGISYIPMILYLIMMGMGRWLFHLTPLETTAGNLVILIIFQVWAMILLSYCISITKFVPFEKGLIISVFLNYGTFITILVISNPII